MGTVYLARDRDLDREVALKVVQLHQEDTERMLREARILARLEHPGIVPVHDVGVLPDGRAWYVMKRVRGQPSRRHARTLSLPDRLRAFERICEAVAFAHAHGVIHRDLKPENVMVGPFGEVLVMDWGVAKAARSRPPLPGRGRGAGRGDGHRRTGTILGHTRIHGPGAGAGRGGADRRAHRRLCPRGDPLLPAGGRGQGAPAPGGDPEPGHGGRARGAVSQRRELSADLGRYLDGLPVAAYRESLIEQAARLFRRYRAPILIVLAYLLMRALLILILGR